jgi:hypothetical protein
MEMVEIAPQIKEVKNPTVEHQPKNAIELKTTKREGSMINITITENN